jgi:hypothetical protein
MIVPKLTPEQRRLVDEYVEVRAKCLAWRPAANPHVSRFAELQVAILAWFEKQDPEDQILAKGNKFSLPVGAKERKRTIVRIPELFRRLGMKWVAEHCKPALGALEKALPKDELAKYVEESRTGPRSLGEPVAH